MKIAVLMDAPLRATLLSEKTMARLAEWGEVAVNETDKAEKETVKQIIAGADIAITSWGVPQLDKEILDCAPNLRFVAHAAGSVKGIVSDELYARGIRVVSSARILSYGVSETALGLTICACKNVFAFNEEICNGGWVEDYSVSSSAVPSVFSEKAAGWVKESGKVISGVSSVSGMSSRAKTAMVSYASGRVIWTRILSAGMRVPVPSSK